MEQPTPTRVTAQLVQALAVAGMEIKERDGFTPFVLIPDGYQKDELLPDYMFLLPDHIRQTVTITDLDSFIAYVKKFSTHTAQIFAIANDTGARFDAALDYHEGGTEGGGNPRRCMHRVHYYPVFTPEFAAWLGINAKPLTQEQFLDHLRKWGDTITSHTDADLIELASSLDFQTSGEFSSHVERVKGGRKLLFNERVEGSATLKGNAVTVPDGITFELPVFTGGREYVIAADLLYRPQGGALRIIVELRRQHLVVRQAVKDIVADVKEGTNIEPFLGQLEL
jgi:uncharacterized protein YfdQ (DUF2303 family)